MKVKDLQDLLTAMPSSAELVVTLVNDASWRDEINIDEVKEGVRLIIDGQNKEQQALVVMYLKPVKAKKKERDTRILDAMMPTIPQPQSETRDGDDFYDDHSHLGALCRRP